MTEYRCTRPDLYPPRTIGHQIWSARQGYYVEASNADIAALEMFRRFPSDQKIDVQFVDAEADYISQPVTFLRINAKEGA